MPVDTLGNLLALPEPRPRNDHWHTGLPHIGPATRCFADKGGAKVNTKSEGNKRRYYSNWQETIG